MSDHTHDGSDESCFGCRIRTIQFSPAATPSRSMRAGKPREVQNSWEKGVAKDHRGMPYLDEKCNEIGLKPWGEKYRRKFAEAKAQEAST